MMETEGEQIGLEWGQLLMQRVLKRFEETTGEKFKKLFNQMKWKTNKPTTIRPSVKPA